jgi:LAS superfamily LD-carboxypeptidase LdcB
MNAEELTGRARTHVTVVPRFGCALHERAVGPFEAMRRAALDDGIEIAAASAFRDFDRQLRIWNEKYRGERPLHDAAGVPLPASSLAPTARVEAILRWTALPGASRHHWGTDLDLIEGGAAAHGYAPRLTPDEYAAGGVFAPLADWLERHAGRFGFFRPYRGVFSGVHAEPWHYSFAPVADAARAELSVAMLREAVAAAPLDGKDEVLVRLGELHERFVRRIDPF